MSCIYEDRGVSRAAAVRPGLRWALKRLRTGINWWWRLDRLGRSLPDLVDIIGGRGFHGERQTDAARYSRAKE